jgi:serine phosphatase RsbU (regulator of sigma subunit)
MVDANTARSLAPARLDNAQRDAAQVLVAERVSSPTRLLQVARTRLLDTEPEEEFDRFARLAAATLGGVTAFITIVDDRRSFWKSCMTATGSTLAVRQNAVEESFCQYVIGTGDPLIVSDARTDPVTRDNPSVVTMGVTSWAGYPVHAPDGEVLGTFCVVGDRPRQWTDPELRILDTLAHAVTGEVALRMALDDARAGSALAKEQAARAEELAGLLQQSLLPPTLPVIPGVDLAAAYQPAGDGVQVLGDFYDAFPTATGWGVVVGDVCGKGAPAARTTAMIRSAVRTLGHDGRNPAQVLTTLEQVLNTWNAGTVNPVAACYTTLTRQGANLAVTLSLAGHPPALLRHPDGHIEEFGLCGSTLGCGLPQPPRDSHLLLTPGSSLLICTDGVSEACRPTTRERYTEARLHTLLTQLPATADAATTVNAVQADVQQFSQGPLHDDIAIVMLANPAPPH